MNKRITSIVLSLVMLFTMLATAVPVLAATPVELKVTADTTSAHPGDTINYKVSVGAVTDMGGLEFKLDIPSGLTVDDSSISIPDGLETIIDSDGPIIVPTRSNRYYWLYSAQLTGYTGTSDLVILTFSCKVDDGTTGTKTVSIKEVVLIDQSVVDMPFNVTGSDVNVTIPHVHVYDKEVATEGYLKTGVTCTEAAVYYKSCECGAKGTETFTSGSALGHDYTKKVENNTYLKTAASNCTEYNVYWYACSRCDANAKDDAEATDKYYTSTTAGNHSFTEKIEDAAHYVAGTGTDCQSVKKYYFDCAYCDQIGTTTWDSTTYGPHNYAATWSSDADGHWHECSLCHDKKDNEAHTPGAAATETTPQKCTKCDYTITPALGHTHSLTKVEANAPTCTEDGNKAYYVCSGCSKWFEDATGNVEITDHSSVVIGHLGHDWADATCTAPKTCSRCGATEGNALGHDFAVSWSSDASGHWHACSRCDAKDGEATHTPDHEGGATYDCAVKCSVCNYVIEPQLEAGNIRIEVPFKLDVKKTGEMDPGKETFKFVVERFGAPVEYVLVQDTIETNGEKTYEGKFIFTIGANQAGNLSEGFVIRQVKGNAEGWTYDETKFYAVPTFADTYTNVAGWRFLKYDENAELDYNNPIEEISFTNSYNAKKPVTPPAPQEPEPPKSPKTGDSSMTGLWIALLFVSGAGVAGTTLYSRKRKSVK